MSPIKSLLSLVVLTVFAGGCQLGVSRPWQQADLPTHDRQRAFNAAKDVLAKHFEIAEASWTRGVIETKPQVFDRKKAGTLADLRGAGGRWRRTVYVEFENSDLTVVALVAVRLEREGTDQAISIAKTGGYGGHSVDVPRAEPFGSASRTGSAEQVWVEVGYDASQAKELLAQISEAIARLEKGEAPPAGLSPKEEAEETRRLGGELDK
jgi:hypothetical protein